MAKQGCEFTTNAHQRSVGRTNDSTLARQGDTSRKHLDVVLLEALRRAMLALRGTLITEFDAIIEHGTTENLVAVHNTMH